MTDKFRTYIEKTHGVEVKVMPVYETAQSNPSIGKFIFSYRVIIENHSEQKIKLLQRHWHIYDSLHSYREVSGEGVVGVQPILLPSQSFEYQSWCPINSAIGKMYGTYTFANFNNRSEFEVQIPTFYLVADFTLN